MLLFQHFIQNTMKYLTKHVMKNIVHNFFHSKSHENIIQKQKDHSNYQIENIEHILGNTFKKSLKWDQKNENDITKQYHWKISLKISLKNIHNITKISLKYHSKYHYFLW